ncbi:MAG: hypothetical protein AAFP86_21225, partial [Planctomycetota bacterium]
MKTAPLLVTAVLCVVAGLLALVRPSAAPGPDLAVVRDAGPLAHRSDADLDGACGGRSPHGLAVESTGLSGAYHAPVGTRFAFELSHRSAVRFGDAPEVTVRAAGSLAETVVARDSGTIVVALEYDLDVRSPGGDANAPERIRQELSEPVFLRIDPFGLPLELSFSDRVGTRTRDLVRNLVCAFRVVARPEETFEFNADEPNGVATLRARWSERVGRGGSVRAERLSFEGLASLGDVGGAPSPVGIAHGSIDGELGWRTAARFTESLDHTAGELLRIRGTGTGSLTLLHEGQDAGAAVLAAYEADARIWVPLHVRAVAADPGAVRALQARQWERKLAGVT